MPEVFGIIPAVIGLFSGGGGGSAPAPPASTPAKPPDQTQQKEQLLAAAPSVQERLGGAVAPDFFASEVARVSGNPQDTDLAKQVLGQFLGLGDSSEKTGAADGTVAQTGGGQNFSTLNVTSGTPTGAAQPNFFEALLGGGHEGGGSGLNDFSGGFS